MSGGPPGNGAGGARAGGEGERGRAGRANGRRERPGTPPNEGSGTRPRARRGTPSHERAPRPPRRSHDRRAASSPDTTATTANPFFPFLLSLPPPHLPYSPAAASGRAGTRRPYRARGEREDER